MAKPRENRRLTDEQVALIRKAPLGFGRSMAISFGVSTALISQIRSGQKYKLPLRAEEVCVPRKSAGED
jgi:hypothetical protein